MQSLHQLEVSPAALPVDRTQTPLRLLSPSKRHQTPGSRMPSQAVRLPATVLEADEEEPRPEVGGSAIAQHIPASSNDFMTPQRDHQDRSKRDFPPASPREIRRPPSGKDAEVVENDDSLVKVLSGAEERLQMLVAQLSTLAAEVRGSLLTCRLSWLMVAGAKGIEEGCAVLVFVITYRKQ